VILVSWREKDGNEWGEWQEREFPDDRLQEFMDRAWKKYGNPNLVLQIPEVLPPPRGISVTEVGRSTRNKKHRG
jgi:hypothetical protein